MSSDALYKIVPINGKGLGMVATTHIPKGTRILAEKPIMKFSHSLIYNEKEINGFKASLMGKVKDLSEEHRQQFLALANAFVSLDVDDSFGDRCIGIVRTNSLPLNLFEKTSGSLKRGIFPVASRINHACDNNCQATWNENIGKYTFHASQELCEGQEITINYHQSLDTFHDRQMKLKLYNNITCTCGFCSLPVDDRNDHDYVIEQARAIEARLADEELMKSDPLNFLQPILTLISTLNDGGIWDSLAPKAYHDAFKVTAYHGDEARAKIFAARAHDAMKSLLGADHLHTIKMKKMMEHPAKDPAFGKSTLWATSIANTPQNLEPARFEAWLWRIKNRQFPGPKVPRAGVLKHLVANLRDTSFFPAYSSLPVTEGEGDFYATSDCGTMYSPVKHWCFLGEIEEVDMTLRVDLMVKDRDGRKIRAVFFTDDRGMGFHQLIRPGNIIAILYPTQARLSDGEEVLLVQSLDTVRIFSLGMDELMTLNDNVQKLAAQNGNKKQCQTCGNTGPALKECDQCCMALYCDRACQIIGWVSEGHKEDCKFLKNANLRGLFFRNWGAFEAHEGFV